MVSRRSAAGDASTGRYGTPNRRTAVARRCSPRRTNRIAVASLVNSWRIGRGSKAGYTRGRVDAGWMDDGTLIFSVVVREWRIETLARRRGCRSEEHTSEL